MSVILLSIFCVSCTKERNSSYFPSPPLTASDRTTPLEYAETAGILHNAGLEFLRLNFDFTQSLSTSAMADTVLYKLCNYYQTAYGWSFSTGYQTFVRDSMKLLCVNDLLGTTAKNLAYLNRIRNSSVMTTYVSSNERQFLDSLHVFFSTNVSGLSKAQVCALAYNKSVNLLSQFNAITWSSGQGTLACGALNVLKSTSTYWAGHDRIRFIGFSGSNGIGGGDEPFVILQADCLGYIWGWGNALIDDANSSGGVTPDGQNRRMQQGFSNAAQASSFCVLF